MHREIIYVRIPRHSISFIFIILNPKNENKIDFFGVNPYPIIPFYLQRIWLTLSL